MLTQAKDILAQIIEHRDFEAMLVYADMLEERGDPLASGWRRIAKEGRWPWRFDFEPDKFAWYDESRAGAFTAFGTTDELPHGVFIRLKQFSNWAPDFYVQYESEKDALDDLAGALAELI